MWRGCAILLFGLLLAAPASWPRDLHFSFWSDDPKPFLAAMKSSGRQALPALPQGERICAGILTHHFLASGMMVRFLAGLRAHTSPETIVLLAPNHYHQGLANISLSSLPWKTPFGVLQADAELVHALGAAIQLPEDPAAFSGEHAVGVLIPFLKYYFPRSRVVPILIDVNARPGALSRLRDALSPLLNDPRMLLLLSMDFSHDSVAAVAEARDAEAREAIASLDSSRTEGLEVDCRKGLWVVLESLKRAGCDGVRFEEHTNSARLTGRPDQADVTSYFAISFLRRGSEKEGRKQ